MTKSKQKQNKQKQYKNNKADQQCVLIHFNIIIYASTNKTDRHDIIEILLKVALNTITPPPF
jgi:hypothetical protein